MPSTVIRAFAYDSETRELTVTFVTGRIYAYLAVPADVYDDFATAFSKGTFFNKHIRDAYEYREITPGKSLSG
jgi:KTSC domain